ncbi:MAG: sulfite exporter TauE/SafE family protein [Bacteroidia bacterium]
MEPYTILLLILVLAFLYSSVGHGGASGYLGMMVLLGVSPAIMKPSALVLNVIVSTIAAIQFYKAGYFRKQLFFPFIILSVPCAFIGAKIPLPDHTYKIILGVCLLISVGRMLMMYSKNQIEKKPLPLIPALIIGAVIGLISGMIGIGGGILLSPLLLIFRWADYKEAAAVAAPFILVNSISGLVGLWSGVVTFPPLIVLWIIAAGLGGFAGSYWGSKKFNTVALKYLLSAVLIIAAWKLFKS